MGGGIWGMGGRGMGARRRIGDYFSRVSKRGGEGEGEN